MHLKVPATLLVLALAGCSQTVRQRPPVPSQLAADYEQLIAMFPEDAQGLGREKVFHTREHQPMTYGLILSAESARFNRTAAPDARRRIRNAARWLIDNRDLDRDGLPGWGLPQAWDAFQDGTTNPVNHPYTITTAIALTGLLDALQLDGVWSPAERDEYRTLVAQVALRWCRDCWSRGFSGGYFWYSSNRADDLFAVNSPAMFLGTLARLLHDRTVPLTPADRRLIESRADDQARSAVATVQLRDGLPFWAYMPLPNFRNSDRPNDLIHHVYTVLGLEIYRDCRGKVPLPWTRAQAVRSLDRFWSQDRIMDYPLPVTADSSVGRPPETQSAMSSKPAILWSAGMLLAGYAQLNDADGAARCVEALKRDYAPWPSLRLYPPDRDKDPNFYPRHAAHVLLGLACHTFGPIYPE